MGDPVYAVYNIMNRKLKFVIHTMKCYDVIAIQSYANDVQCTFYTPMKVTCPISAKPYKSSLKDSGVESK
jgi:hypothetical protein